MSEILDRLCACCGVLPSYQDIWGTLHRPSDTARRALLAAMGVAAETDEAAAASLRHCERQAWTRLLPPVRVVREDARPFQIPVTLPAGHESARRRWRLSRESGDETSGEFVPRETEELERHAIDGEEFVRYALTLDVELGPGYHRFAFEDAADGEDRTAAMALIVAPATCYQPLAIQGEGRVWGFAAQLYGLRSERNWGIGDFGDLRGAIEFCADSGAATVLLNPLHALFPDNPQHASPYSPSSRAYFNILYLDVEGIADFAESAEVRQMVRAPAFQARLRALRATEQVDYAGVAEVKSAVLKLLYQNFRSRHLAAASERARAFRAFQQEHGETLRDLALFDALQAHFRQADNAMWGWPVWPDAYRDPHTAEVAAFCEQNLEAVEYFEYLQWLAASQLRAVGTRSWELGLGIGVMLDLAVGVAEGGAATWTRRGLYALGASAGAPPDEINRLGQDWGLPPWIPHALQEAAYAPFIELLRANMRDAGALRLDHVMGLYRLFWVARGLPPVEGAYVAYPFADLLGILALESQRNRCMVLGEDLGTVPPEVREALQPMGVLSTRLLYFERRDDGRLQPPQAWPANAAAAVTTHDLPTLAGFWQGLDIDLRDRLHLFPDTDVRDQQVIDRSEDRAQLLVALEHEGILPPAGGLQPVAFPEMTPALAAAVYAYLGRAPSKLLLVQLEDALAVREQPNLPGTTDATYPCWRLKMPLDLESWGASAAMQGILEALRAERPVKLVGGGPRGGTGEGLRSWIPRATYRLQLNSDFPLAQATGLLPYLDALGLSHCYLSPILKARPGSRHGYDITDHSRLNPEIASAEDFERFAAELRRREMGLIMDVVPNHMGIMGADNAWWLDVLENGPASRFAGYFDIDWYPLAAGQTGRVLLPVLGEHYGAVLEDGQLRLDFDAEQGAFDVWYYEHRFPVDPREYPRILRHGLTGLQARLGEESDALREFLSLLTAFEHLPERDDVRPEAVAERARDKEVHKRHLKSLCASSPDIAQFVRESVDAVNDPASGTSGYGLLHDLLQAQAYRLASWRVAADEINYRRFFDINDLAALRMDIPEVFAATHRLLRELLGRGYVNGLRIDHPDGLYAPQRYFQRLQAMATSLLPGADDAPESAAPTPLYIVVEKILAIHEHLPESWPVDGTTGYDFGAACTALTVDGEAEAAFTRIYESFIRARPRLDEMMRANKHLIMETALAGELQVLATQLARIAKQDRRTCDFTLNSLRAALADVVASFPVYRTYVTGGEASSEDARYVDWAVGVARQRSRAVDRSIFDFVRDVLLGRQGEGRDDDYRRQVEAFAMKFQQYSSPVMAKAVEDTSFYQYNRLISLNEVGGDPQRFGASPSALHRANQERARHWPHALLSSSTHDSKRAEDVRARIDALSEMPAEWHKALLRWSKLNRSKRCRFNGGSAPSRNDEYLLYQTLLGVWPFEALDDTGLKRLTERVEAYMLKAVREAKVHSAWSNPDLEYEEAVGRFVRALLAPDATNLFLRDFLPFQRRLARLGAFNSLAQLLLKLTSPGVPDIYQGSEMWNFTLVDPDNRGPVDFAARRRALDEIQSLLAEQGVSACASALLDTLGDGRIKLFMLWKVLGFRRMAESLFRDGDYLPLKTGGARADHLFAFARKRGGETLVVAVPRLFAGLMGDGDAPPTGAKAWGDTWLELPPDRVCGRWQDVLLDREVTDRGEGEPKRLLASELFGGLPYALLWSGKAAD